jgi:predicted nucleic acid-binding protein
LILYADTSAFVPLVIDEPSSSACAELWDAADRVTAVRVMYVEACAALAMAERLGRVSRRQAALATRAIDDLWTAVDVVELDAVLMMEAARLARTRSLRGYDATHCAAALTLRDPELVAASGDAALLAAWHSEGVATRDTNA